MTRRWVAPRTRRHRDHGVPNVPDGVVYAAIATAGSSVRRRRRGSGAGLDLPRAEQGTVADSELRLVHAMRRSGRAPRPPARCSDRDLAQFFCGWAGVIVAALRRRPFVSRSRLVAESIEAVGAMRNRGLLRFLEWMEQRMYAAASRIRRVGDGYRAKLIERGVPSQRIDSSPMASTSRCSSRAPTVVRYVSANDLGDRFVCAYLGTIGMGSGSTWCCGRRRLASGGRRRPLPACRRRRGAEELGRRRARRGSNRSSSPPPAEERHAAFLAATDACLVHLTRTDLFKTVLRQDL